MDPQSEFSLSFDWKELKMHSTEILDLPEKLCQEKNIRMVLCLDEFQNLAGVPEYESLEKKMRAIWQRQKRVSYCLYGSKKSMMSEIFNNPSKPFYRFGELMMLGKIKREKWVEFIVSGFKRTNKSISPALAEMIAQTMNDHSWYVQQLAHYTWTISKKKVGSEDVSNALSELIRANSPLYQREIEFLSPTRINLLKATWKGESKLTSKSVMDDYKLGTPNNVSKNKKSLKRNDIIHEEERGLDFLNPAFKIWFGGAFFNYSLPQMDKGKGK